MFRIDPTGKYEYAEENGNIGYRRKPCGCGGKDRNADSSLYSQNMDTLLFYKGVTPTSIEGISVHPNMLVLGLSQEDFDKLKSDPMKRFMVPAEKQRKQLLGRFGKVE